MFVMTKVSITVLHNYPSLPEKAASKFNYVLLFVGRIWEL